MPALREVLADFGIKFPTAEAHRADAAVQLLVEGVKGFAATLVAGATAGAIKDFVLGLVDQADALGDTSAALGVNAQTLQSWRYAAERAGGSGDAVVGALAKIQKQVAESPEGFTKLGIKVKDANGQLRGAADLFEEAAAKIADIQNPTEQAAAASKIFGRSFLEIIPLLKQGSKGIAELRAHFAELGGGFDDDFITKAGEIDDQLKDLEASSLSLKVAIADDLLPVVKKFFDLALRGEHVIREWVIRTRDWVKHTKLLEATLVSVGVRGIAFLSGKIGPLGAAFRALFRVVMAGLRPLAGMILKTVLPFLALEDIIVFLAGGDSLLGRGLDKAFGPGTQDKVRAFTDSVGEAAKAFNTDTLTEFFDFLEKDIKKSGGQWGEFGAAAAAAGGYAVNTLTGGWDNFFRKLAAWIDALAFNFKVVWDDIQTIGLSAAAALSDAFDSVWNGAIDGAEAAVKALAAVLSHIPGAGDLAKGLADVGKDLEGSKRAADAGETVERGARRQQKKRLAEGEDILGRLAAPPPGAPKPHPSGSPAPKAPAGSATAPTPTAPIAVPLPPVATVASAPVTNVRSETKINAPTTITNTTNVHVKADTPAETTDAVRSGAEAGSKKGVEELRAARAALVHTVP